MSRKQIAWLCVIGAVVAFIIALIVGYQIAAPKFARGTAATETTVAGWAQLAGSILAACGLTGAGLWQMVLAYLDSHSAQTVALVKKIAPSATDKQVTGVMAYVHIERLEADIESLPDGNAKGLLIAAAREACDEMRNAKFPVAALPNVVASSK